MNAEGLPNERMIDALLGGEVDPELGTILESADALYASGPDEGRRAQAYTRLKRDLAAWRRDAIAYDKLEGTPFGELLVAASDHGVVALAFGGDEADFRNALEQGHHAAVLHDPVRLNRTMEQLGEYFSGARNQFDIHYDLRDLTPFQRSVLRAVQQVPKGSYVTYGELAERIGKPQAARAVGQALGRNPIPILIPCHRVIATDGSLGGYSGPGGVETKSALLRMEGAVL